MSSLALALLLTTAQASEPASFKLDLGAPKARLILGEPLKLNLTWTALHATEITANADQVRWFIDSGTGFEPYTETSFGTAFVVHVPESLKAGEVRKAAQVLAVSGNMSGAGAREFRLLFPAPGRYRVKTAHGNVSSNEVAIEVSAAQGRDAELLSRLQGRLELLSEAWAFLENADAKTLRHFVEDYATSPILARQQLLVWKWRAGKAHAEAQGGGAQPAQGALLGLFREIEVAGQEEAPFDEDRLLLLADLKLHAGLRAEALDVYRELVAKYPDGAPAAKVITQMAKEDAGNAAAAEVIKQMQKQLREQGLELPVPSPTPPPQEH